MLITATGLGVVLMLTLFTVAPLLQYPASSVALMNLRTLTGHPCGLATSVTVFADVTPGLGPAGGVAALTRDMREAPLPESPHAPPVWHDDVSGGTGTGTVQTPWYPLPGPVPDGRVVVPLLGTLTEDQLLVVQVGAGNPASLDLVRTVPLDVVGQTTGWTEVTVTLADAGLDEPSAVRCGW